MAIVNVVDFYGQSLSTGYNSTAYTTSAPAGTYNKKCSTGGIGMVDYSAPNATVRNAGSLVSLVEVSVETGVAACCNYLSARYPEMQFAGFSAGVSGTPLSDRIKGTSIYTAHLGVATALNALIVANGDTARCLGVCMADGESDLYSGATYYTEASQIGLDLDVDLRGIFNQTQSIPLILSQPIGDTGGTYDTLAAQCDLAMAFPSRIYCFPKYNLYSSDSLHLTGSTGYTVMGQTFAKVLQAVSLAGGQWVGCLPVTCLRTTSTVDLTVNCELGPLVIDTTVVSDPGNYGFEWYDSTSSATVSSVAIVAPNKVRVTLSGTPTGASKALRYAFTASPARSAGAPVTGRRGCIRDSAGNYLPAFNLSAT